MNMHPLFANHLVAERQTRVQADLAEARRTTPFRIDPSALLNTRVGRKPAPTPCPQP